MTPQIDIYLNTDCSWLTEELLAHWQERLQCLLPELMQAPPGPEHVLSTLELVEISIVDDATIARIHGEFLNDPTPTDAITFPYGEIIVSSDTAERYAREHTLCCKEELFRYMVHGLTHLHGYLDYEPTDREALFAVQEPLVQRFYSASEHGA